MIYLNLKRSFCLRLRSLVNFEIWQRRFFDGEAVENKEIELEEAVLV